MDKPLVKVTHKNCYAYAKKLKQDDNLVGSVSDLAKHIYHSGKAGYILNKDHDGELSVLLMCDWQKTKQGPHFWGGIHFDKFIPNL